MCIMENKLWNLSHCIQYSSVHSIILGGGSDINDLFDVILWYATERNAKETAYDYIFDIKTKRTAPKLQTNNTCDFKTYIQFQSQLQKENIPLPFQVL